MAEPTTENGAEKLAGDEPASVPKQSRWQQPGTRQAADRAIEEITPTQIGQEASTGDEDAHVPQRGWRQRLKTWQAAVLAIGAIAGALIAVLDIKDRLFPGPSPSPSGRSASFTQVELAEKNAFRHAYCRDEFEGETLQDCLAGHDSVGNVFSVGIELKGYEGVCCSLQWTLENLSLGTVPSGFRDVVAVPDIEPRNPLGDIRIFRIFVPNAAQAGKYAVQFALADRDGTIKEASSKPFLVF